MIWLTVLAAVGWGVWYLWNLPVPEDVVIRSKEGVVALFLKDDAPHEKSPYFLLGHDYESLLLPSTMFIGLRARWLRRRLLQRRKWQV